MKAAQNDVARDTFLQSKSRFARARKKDRHLGRTNFNRKSERGRMRRAENPLRPELPQRVR